MKTIREFEERLHAEIANGEIAGFTHLYAGQEAVAVGVCENLGPQDFIVSTHRGHGHCIAKGCDVKGMMKEIYRTPRRPVQGQGRLDAHRRHHRRHAGRERHRRRRRAAGRRRGASRRRWTAQGKVVGGVQRRRRLQPGHDVRGDEHGRRAEAAGDLRVREQPLLASTPASPTRSARKDIAGRAAGFGMLARKADGCDFLASTTPMAEIVEHVPRGQGPGRRSNSIPSASSVISRAIRSAIAGPARVERIRETRDCLKIFREQRHRGTLLDGERARRDRCRGATR